MVIDGRTLNSSNWFTFISCKFAASSTSRSIFVVIGVDCRWRPRGYIPLSYITMGFPMRKTPSYSLGPKASNGYVLVRLPSFILVSSCCYATVSALSDPLFTATWQPEMTWKYKSMLISTRFACSNWDESRLIRKKEIVKKGEFSWNCNANTFPFIN